MAVVRGNAYIVRWDGHVVVTRFSRKMGQVGTPLSEDVINERNQSLPVNVSVGRHPFVRPSNKNSVSINQCQSRKTFPVKALTSLTVTPFLS